MKSVLAKWLFFSAGMFALMDPERWAISAAAILAALLKPALRWPALMLASVLMWFSRYHTWGFPGDSVIFQLAAVAASYLLACLCLSVHGKSKAWLLLPFMIFFGIVIAGNRLGAGSTYFLFFLLTGLSFIGMLWPLTASGWQQVAGGRFSGLKNSFLLLPFWQFSTATPIPVSPVALYGYEVKNEEERLAAQAGGLRLLCYCLLFRGVLGVFNLWAFGEPFGYHGHKALRMDGTFDGFLRLHGTDFFPWLGALVAPVFRFLLHFTVEMGMGVAIARMMGFHLPKAVDRPYRSVGFTDFFGRILYYYNQVLLKGIFPFFRHSVPHAVPQRYRLSLVIFLTVWLGGFFFHFLRDLPRVMGARSVLEFLLSYLSVMPYYFLLGIVAAVASARRHRGDSPGALERAARSFVYLLLYAVIFSFNLLLRHDGKSWQQFLDAYTIWLK